METSEIKERLNNRKLKATTIRVAVLEQFFNEENALPVSKVQETLGDFDRVTFYRTIKSLEESGIIHKALEEDQETFYALCNSCTSHNHNHSHIHFKCNSCGEVSCLDANYSITLTNEAFKIENLNVKANGVCKKCA